MKQNSGNSSSFSVTQTQQTDNLTRQEKNTDLQKVPCRKMCFCHFFVSQKCCFTEERLIAIRHKPIYLYREIKLWSNWKLLGSLIAILPSIIWFEKAQIMNSFKAMVICREALVRLLSPTQVLCEYAKSTWDVQGVWGKGRGNFACSREESNVPRGLTFLYV